jgi:peptidoglycan/LPS O-acetylase OafA/YrhL
MKAPQINSLTATRAFAAILVFIHHYGGEIYPFTLLPAVFRSGNIAVSYFFVLSGFVLYITYRDRKISYADYIKRRIGRIYPTYIVALLLSVIVLAAYYNYSLSSVRSAKEIGLSALLLQAYVPSYPLTLNGPGWSISVEMLFYFVFPAALFLQQRKSYLFALILGIFFISSQLLHLRYYPYRHSLPDNIVDTVFFNPVIHLSQFMMGMVAGWLFTRSTLQ